MRHVRSHPVLSFHRRLRPAVFGLLDSLAGADGSAQTYPPYNIERTGENAYRITMAVAGFGEGDLSIEAKENTLTVKGEKKAETEEKEAEFLYRGIGARAFERRFQLADHVEVKGANLENGLLHVDLVREIPEAMKPRTIAIAAARQGQADRSGRRLTSPGVTRGLTSEGRPTRAPFSFAISSPSRTAAKRSTSSAGVCQLVTRRTMISSGAGPLGRQARLSAGHG